MNLFVYDMYKNIFHAKLYLLTISLNFLSPSCISGTFDSLLNHANTFGYSLLSSDFLCNVSTVWISLYICISATVYSSPHKNSYLYSFLSSMWSIWVKNSSSVALISSYGYCFSPKACGPITILIRRWLHTLMIDWNQSKILSMCGLTSAG